MGKQILAGVGLSRLVQKIRGNYCGYVTCSTAASTAAKAVSVSNFSLVTSATVKVKFTAANIAANPTLNVTNTGAKAIYYKGAAIPAALLVANGVYEFVYNGSQYELLGGVDTYTKVEMDSKIAALNDSLAQTNAQFANSTKPLRGGNGRQA